MYGAKIKFTDGDIYREDFATRHAAKSFAGAEFHSEAIESAVAFNEAGQVALYLRKDANGVHREENREVM